MLPPLPPPRCVLCWVQAICVRSVEGGRRIISEVVATLNLIQERSGDLGVEGGEVLLRLQPVESRSPASRGAYMSKQGAPAAVKVQQGGGEGQPRGPTCPSRGFSAVVKGGEGGGGVCAELPHATANHTGPLTDV